MLDRADFEALYLECEGPFYNIALRWTWNAAAAQEIVQEIFLRLWSRRLVIRRDRAGAYAYRCLLNLCHDHARARRRSPEMTHREPVDRSGRSAEATVLFAQLRRALDSLSDEQRDVVLLSEFAGLKQREIADLLRIAPGTVASRKNAALNILRRRLS